MSLHPQHDAPMCAHCQCQTVTPMALYGSLLAFRCDDMREMVCVACGHTYREEGDARVARAWWSAGAYAGSEATKADRTAGSGGGWELR